MKARASDLYIGRILNEDDDWVTLEIAKRDDVTFHLQQNEEGETVGGDQFLTTLFIRSAPAGGVEVWHPWPRTRP